MAPLTAIPCFTWIPSNSPKAVLLCIHGLGLYGGTYSALGECMARLGIATYAVDVRGFGGWLKLDNDNRKLNFKTCSDDIAEFLERIHQQHPNLPVYILGESLGGTVAASAAECCPNLVDGLILSAPARVVYNHKREIAQIAFRAITNPGKPISISHSVFKHAPHVVAWQESDPLIRLDYSVPELWHLLHFLGATFKRLRYLPDIPVLVVQGHSDTLINTASTIEFFEQLPCTDKQLVILGSAGHLIFQSQELTPKAVSLVHDWIADHLVAELPTPIPFDQQQLRRAS